MIEYGNATCAPAATVVSDLVGAAATVQRRRVGGDLIGPVDGRHVRPIGQPEGLEHRPTRVEQMSPSDVGYRVERGAGSSKVGKPFTGAAIACRRQPAHQTN
jgi:hypothetical protein